jgi:hypothetical protein
MALQMAAASKPSLLVTGAGSSIKIHQIDILMDGSFVAPFHWVIRKRITGSALYTPDMTTAIVRESRLAGIAGPQEVGAPLFSPFFILLFLVGLFSLSIPVRIRLELAEPRSIALMDLVELLKGAVRQNPGHYTRASASEIESRLNRAKTFAQMREAFE